MVHGSSLSMQTPSCIDINFTTVYTFNLFSLSYVYEWWYQTPGWAKWSWRSSRDLP